MPGTANEHGIGTRRVLRGVPTVANVLLSRDPEGSAGNVERALPVGSRLNIQFTVKFSE